MHLIYIYALYSLEWFFHLRTFGNVFNFSFHYSFSFVLRIFVIICKIYENFANFSYVYPCKAPSVYCLSQ